jgi:BMFP domain-containing protein YqiC
VEEEYSAQEARSNLLSTRQANEALQARLLELEAELSDLKT